MWNLFSHRIKCIIGRVIAITMLLNLNIGWAQAVARPLLVNLANVKPAKVVAAVAKVVAGSELQQLQQLPQLQSLQQTRQLQVPVESCCDQLISFLEVIDSKISCTGTLCSSIDCLKQNICDSSSSTLLKDRIRCIQCMICRLICAGCLQRSRIDVVDSKINIIASDLASCCESMEANIDNVRSVVEDIDSKVDILLQSPQDLSHISSTVDVIDSKVTVVSNELSSCCASIETNFDNVLSSVEVVDSKVDILLQSPQDLSHISSTVDVIDSKVTVVSSELASCCASIATNFDNVLSSVDVVDSKVDILLQSPQDLSHISSTVDVIDSKVTVVSNELASCCASIATNFDNVLSSVDVVDSKVDILLQSPQDLSHISSTVDVIDSKVTVVSNELASCCASIATNFDNVLSSVDVVDSKVDILLQSPQDLSHISSTVDVIDSKVTVVSSELASCCASIATNFDNVLSAIDASETNVLSSVDVVDSKVDILLQSSQDLSNITSKVTEIDSKVDVLSADLASCCASIATNFDNVLSAIDSSEVNVLSAVDEVESKAEFISSKMAEDFAATFTTLTTIDSKIDELILDFQATSSNLETCCSALESDFAITWTMIGDATASSVDLVNFSTVDQIDSAQLSVISWLKSIARQLAPIV